MQRGCTPASKPHEVPGTSWTPGHAPPVSAVPRPLPGQQEGPGQATDTTASPSPHLQPPAPAPNSGTLPSECLSCWLSGGFAPGPLHRGRLPSQVFLPGDGEGGRSQNSTQQVGADRGSPLGLSSGIVPSHPPEPTPPPPLHPPGLEPSGPRSSLAQRQPRRARFNWGLRDVRTWGPRARAAGGGAPA